MSDCDDESPPGLAAFFLDRLSMLRPPPPADPYWPTVRPHAMLAGANRYGLVNCALCGKPGTDSTDPDMPRGFYFREPAGALAYAATGCCQTCQDAHGEPDEGE